MPDSQSVSPRTRGSRTFAQLVQQHRNFDDPPASGSDSVSGHHLRRSRLRRALEHDGELARELPAYEPSSIVSAREFRPLGQIRRRRPRSSSDDGRMAESGRESSPEYATESRRRTKRRKTQPSDPRRRDAIKYGYYGQVEPGRLKLELVSCDGGEHADKRYPTLSLGPGNVLRLDKSVYCSERPSSTLILCHADSDPFCLERLHIVAPEHGFTAPVREGLAYVAIALRDLHKYLDPPAHACRAGIDTPPYRLATGRPRRRTWFSQTRSRETDAQDTGITLQDALRDPEIDSARETHQAQRGYERFGTRAEEGRSVAASDEAYYREAFGLDPTEADVHCDVSEFNENTAASEVGDEEHDATATHQSAAVTLLSDDSPGPEDISSPTVLDFRLDRLRTMRRRFDLEDVDRGDRWFGASALPPLRAEDGRDTTLSRLDQLMHRSRIYDSPNPEPARVNPRRAAEVEEQAELNGRVDANVVAARFNIKRGKHKVTIKFDPPVSGRFILLKLWANKRNVDVQSVVATGFGGCRFFPAVERR